MDQQNSGRRGGIGGREFVLGQLLAIASTIIGVYLAGYVGFQRTLEYDAFRNARERLNVLQALHEELDQNLDILDAHLVRMKATHEGKPLYGDWPRQRLYLWHAAAESPALFEAPAETLAHMQAFYAETGELLADETLHKAYSGISSSNAYERKQTDERLEGLMRTARADLLPALEQAMAAPRKRVDEYSAWIAN